MYKGFWDTIAKPAIGLSPMDGVTDAAYRYIADTYGHPDILYTEFTNVEGISRGVEKLLTAFVHHSTSTPTVGQIFGSEPAAFYQAAMVLAEMGFDGVDINMGCPDRNVAKHGGGAALILRPQHAQQIVRMTQQGIQDWAAGKTLHQAGLPESISTWVSLYRQKTHIAPERRLLPVSVKTRIGYDAIVTEDWIKTLLEVEPAVIAVHGRTLKQLYSGEANWEEIGKAARLIKQTSTLVLGNGDIKSRADAHEKIRTYGTDGALIGRAAFGDPWVFQGTHASITTKMDIALEHCRAFMELTPHLNFLSLRKHIGWYCRGFNDATGHRMRLMQTTNIAEVESVIADIKKIL